LKGPQGTVETKRVWQGGENLKTIRTRKKEPSEIGKTKVKATVNGNGHEKTIGKKREPVGQPKNFPV